MHSVKVTPFGYANLAWAYQTHYHLANALTRIFSDNRVLVVFCNEMQIRVITYEEI